MSDTAAPHCRTVAVVSGNHFPCRNHDGGVHHFAVYWPACPAPFCKLPPEHAGLHDIPPGQPELIAAKCCSRCGYPDDRLPPSGVCLDCQDKDAVL